MDRHERYGKRQHHPPDHTCMIVLLRLRAASSLEIIRTDTWKFSTTASQTSSFHELSRDIADICLPCTLELSSNGKLSFANIFLGILSRYVANTRLPRYRMIKPHGLNTISSDEA